MSKDRMYERLGVRYGFGVGLFLTLCLLVAAILIGLSISFKDAGFRTTMVMVGNPMNVVSWDRQRKTFISIKIPAETTIEAVTGYGNYSLEALWKLGTIDKKGGLLLSQSIEEALGTAIPYYIGLHNTDVLFSHEKGFAGLRRIFSPIHVFSYVRGAYRTNIPLPLFLSLSWTLQFSRPDQLNEIDFTSSNALIDTTRADGTHIQTMDSNRIDELLGTMLEDERIRTEALRVAVYNSTQTLALGTRVGRLLGHMGALVVAVGNSEPLLDQCELWGRKILFKSTTARFVQSHFHCIAKESEEEGRADLTIKLGKTYEARFLPPQE